jgi:hypothetical protein
MKMINYLQVTNTTPLNVIVELKSGPLILLVRKRTTRHIVDWEFDLHELQFRFQNEKKKRNIKNMLKYGVLISFESVEPEEGIENE